MHILTWSGAVSLDGLEFTLPSFFPGWLHKEVKNSPKMSSLKLKKRWFVLTHNSLDYYKSSEKNALKLGTLVLNSLCSVVPPDEKIFKETGEGYEHWPETGPVQSGGVWVCSEQRTVPPRVCTFFAPKFFFFPGLSSEAVHGWLREP